MKTEASPSKLALNHPSRNAVRFWCGLPLIVCLMVGQARAATAVMFTNNFEAYTTIATNLTDVSDADPSGSEWNMNDDNPAGGTNSSGVQVINWQVHSSPNALLLRSGTTAEASFRGPIGGLTSQLDFWLYVHKAPGNLSFRITVRGEGGDRNEDDYLAYGSVPSTANNIRFYDGVTNTPASGYWSNTVVAFAEDTWQHHRVVMDTARLKMSVYIDDMVTPVLNDVDLGRGDVPVPTGIRFQHEGDSADDGYIVVDDVLFTMDTTGTRDLSSTFTEGFETHAARTSATDDANPGAPWITVETIGAGAGKALAPERVQVVNATEVTPHSGTNCIKLEGGQRANISYAWGLTPQADVQITWWARVPASPTGGEFNYLRMSLYGAEGGNTIAGDSALLGYACRQATLGTPTSLTYYTTAWQLTGIDFIPDTWEEYRLTTHNSVGRYTIVKNPSSANPVVVVDRAPYIGTATTWGPTFMVAWSSSNGSGHPPVYVDDIEIKSLVSNPDPLPTPYSVQFHGNRFTNFTMLQVNGTVGKAVVDPRDNETILFALDVTPPAGGIYRAQKVASGNWSIDPTPIVAGLDRPSGLAIQTNGTIWWTHDFNNDFTRSLGRLKWPWASNVPETIIADINDPLATTRDDDAIDVTVAPLSFSGSFGQPGWILVADRGVDGDVNNAVYGVDPATTTLDQVGYNNFLVSPTAADLGNNLNAIASLPASGELITLSEDGTLVAVDGNGSKRYINALNLWPLAGPNSAAAIAADPLTGKIWGADDLKDELWSIDASSGADQREVSFPLTNPNRTDQQLDVHDPGLSFAANGAVMVLSDTSVANGGGRLIIFHNEPIALPEFSISSVTRVAQGVQLSWQSAGGAKYDLQRATDVANSAGFQNIATNLTTTQFTDTNAPSGAAFYRVIAKP